MAKEIVNPAPTPQEDEPEVTATEIEIPAPVEEVTEELVPLETEHITVNEEGEFVFSVDSENPDATVYKGKTLDELLFNMKKGSIEKDATIARMKAQGFSPKAGKDASIKGTAPMTTEVAPPDDAKIYSDVLKAVGVKPEMMDWTDEDWRTSETDNGAVKTMELKQQVRQARAEFDARMSEENIVYVNNLNLANEVNLIVSELVQAGYTPEDVNLDEVIESVSANVAYWQPDGVRTPGAIAMEVTKALTKIVEKKTEKTTERKFVLGVKKTPPKPSGPKGTEQVAVPAKPKPSSAGPQNTKDAMSSILAEVRAKGGM